MKLEVDEALLAAVLKGTARGLEMTGCRPPPVGATRLMSTARALAVIVGLGGRSNGSVTLSMSDRAMLFLAGRLLGEDIKEANEDAFDAIMEIGNMVAGSIKDALDGSSYEITAISVPALVLGASYEVYFARGITAVSVDFELTDMPFSWHRDRIMSTSVSLLRRSGGAK